MRSQHLHAKHIVCMVSGDRPYFEKISICISASLFILSGVIGSSSPKTEVILTLGSDGSMWAGEGGSSFCPACRVQAVDTTGAGDTFTGYFLRGILGEDCGLDPLTLATQASAIAVTRPGAAPSVPALPEVLAFRNGK